MKLCSDMFFASTFGRKFQTFLEKVRSPNWRKFQAYGIANIRLDFPGVGHIRSGCIAPGKIIPPEIPGSARTRPRREAGKGAWPPFPGLRVFRERLSRAFAAYPPLAKGCQGPVFHAPLTAAPLRCRINVPDGQPNSKGMGSSRFSATYSLASASMFSRLRKSQR